MSEANTPKKTLLDHVRGLDKDGLAAFATRAGTSSGNVLQVAYGHGSCSSEMARKLAEATDWTVTPHCIAPRHYPYPSDGLPPEKRSAA